MSTCPLCCGPDDVLHTQQECEDLAGFNTLTDGERQSLALVAAIISRAPSPISAAARLLELGVLPGAR